jgi:hypothetical protein
MQFFVQNLIGKVFTKGGIVDKWGILLISVQKNSSFVQNCFCKLGVDLLIVFVENLDGY